MTLHFGDERDGFAVDTNAGGRICSLVLAGRERILQEPAAAIEPSFAWGCFLMAPFAGRVRNGSLRWRDSTYQLPLNGGRHAIHGAVFDAPWDVYEHTDSSIALTCAFDSARWPFRGEMLQAVEIEPGRITLEALIRAREPMPVSLGWHPWFADADGCIRIRLQADNVLSLGSDRIPTGETVPVDDRTDLRDGPITGGRRLDDAYAAVRSPVIVTWPDIELSMDFGPPINPFVVYRHPKAVCVEPMTAWPDAVRLAGEGHDGTGLIELEEGAQLRVSTTWSWRPVER